ncbi:MAG: cation:proton antiporter [Piscinibacter sp.]|uniref:cation:proton antiporter n=1 Tax=Piscinibacter TaxID=1114981 RepID=UPI000FDD47B7|nr:MULTISPECIES: cation:proton antiporter [Piscinibacter]MCW5663337.1 cation:proton antiporter [Piscinibacter sp.]
MTIAASAASAATAASAPLWTLDGLRAADPVLGIALLMLIAILLAETLHRLWRLPRICGHMLTGAIAGPVMLRVLDGLELDPWKPLIDLAIGALLFELGARIRPRWLIDNPWLAASCVLQSLLAGTLVAGALVLLGAPWLTAAVAGTVALASSPVIVLAVAHETRARGQVTERLLMMTVVNAVLAVIGLKVLRILMASDSATAGDEFLRALVSALRVISGSFLLGVACGFALDRLSPLVRGTPAMPVLQIALVIIASMLAAQWTLSPLLALLVAGMTARARMKHGLTVEPHLGSAGAVLSVVLFISLGLLFTLEGLATLWPWVLAIIAARLVGSALAIGALARVSGLGWRQAGALALALQPMSSLAVLLAADTFSWSTQLPGAHTPTIQALLLAVTLMQLTGPVWTQLSLRHVARETN